MLQGDVPRHVGAEGEGIPKATQRLHVARQCDYSRGCRRHKTCMLQEKVLRQGDAQASSATVQIQSEFGDGLRDSFKAGAVQQESICREDIVASSPGVSA
ncbi:unnamed protein product [Prunus armeniaca]